MHPAGGANGKSECVRGGSSCYDGINSIPLVSHLLLLIRMNELGNAVIGEEPNSLMDGRREFQYKH